MIEARGIVRGAFSSLRPSTLTTTNSAVEGNCDDLPETHETSNYNVFRGHLTFLTAQGFSAAGVPTQDGVRVFHGHIINRAIVAGAQPFTALSLLALGFLALDFGGAGDQSETVRAVDGVAESIS